MESGEILRPGREERHVRSALGHGRESMYTRRVPDTARMYIPSTSRDAWSARNLAGSRLVHHVDGASGSVVPVPVFLYAISSGKQRRPVRVFLHHPRSHAAQPGFIRPCQSTCCYVALPGSFF